MTEIYLDKAQRDALRKRAQDPNRFTQMNYAVIALADTCEVLEQSAREGEEAYHKLRERAEEAEAERDECEQGAVAQAQFAATWLARLSAERDRLRAALERIAAHYGGRWAWDADGIAHRLDTPQEIAQQALGVKEHGG